MKRYRQYIPLLDQDFDAFEPAILHDLAKRAQTVRSYT